MYTRVIIIAIVITFLLAILGVVGWFWGRGGTEVNKNIQGGILNFFPFGNGPLGTGSGGEGGKSLDSAVELPALRQLSKEPIAGAIAFTIGNRYGIRYSERATGHTFDAFTDDAVPRRVSNTTIPKVYEALWFPDISSVILRYLEEDESITTYFGTLKKGDAAQETRELVGAFLPKNIRELVRSQGGGKIAYIAKSGAGESLILAEPSGTNAKELFSSAIRGWTIGWPATSTIMLATKPSFAAPGYLYLINTGNGKVVRLMGERRGLTTLINPQLTSVLFSESTETDMALNVLDIKSGAIVELPLATLAEKCVWSEEEKLTAFCAAPASLPSASYPDDWYQGTVSFSDELWKIDAASGSVTLLDELLDDAGTSIDATHLQMSSDEAYLFFINKNDSTLWSLKLNNLQPTTTPP